VRSLFLHHVSTLGPTHQGQGHDGALHGLAVREQIASASGEHWDPDLRRAEGRLRGGGMAGRAAGGIIKHVRKDTFRTGGSADLTEIHVTPKVVGLEAAPDIRDRQRGGTSLGICGQPCRDLKSIEFCGAVDWNANVAEVEGMIQVFLQVLNMREAPPQIGIVYDSDYAYKSHSSK
jgi:hypothetical protein